MLSIQPEKPGAGVWSWGFSGRVPLETLLAPPSVGRGAREGGGGVMLCCFHRRFRYVLHSPHRGKYATEGNEGRRKKKRE